MLREPYRFASYWESLKKSAGNIKRPIYMWDCFSPANVGIADLESYVDEIAFALNSCGVDHHEISLELEQLDIPDSEYDTYSAKVYSILYLVRCALISRLSGDINLTFRPEFNSPLGLDRFGRSYWEKLISVAERSLGRNPLNGDMGFKSCGERIAFEGGLPLRSLQGDITYVARGLRNIYRLRKNDLSTCEKVLKHFIDNALFIKPNGPEFWIPIGRMFYEMGMKLFDYIEKELKKNDGDVNEIEILKRLGFDNPSEQIVKFIFE